MKYYTHFLSSDLVNVVLTPETEYEDDLLRNAKPQDDEVIELYYQIAIKQLGTYALLEVVNMSTWPNSATVKVQKIIGVGN